jgi:dTDP-4-amino-4,6-dideoxygalactose transaminase
VIGLADPRFGPAELDAIGRVLASGNLTQGPVVKEFEEAVASFCGVRHAVATTSATTALELVLAALDIGPGDEVVVADFTYPASGNAVLARGATPRLADVDRATYCVDPACVEAQLTERTRAVMAVDVFGLPADYTALEPLLERRGIPLVCDAACSLGGAVGGRGAGSFGVAGCFSFHPRKSLTTGEGGMAVCDDGALADRMRRLRNHGGERQGWRTTFVEPGFNFRMSDLNAALGLAQVPRHAGTVATRAALAARLAAQIEDLPGIRVQSVPEGFRHPFQAFVVVCDEGIDRDGTIAALRGRGVEATLGTYALHAEPSFMAACGTRPGDLPNSFALAQRTLALPLHQGLTEDDVDTVAKALAEVI